MVEFPTNNLDLSHFVQDYQFLVSQDISCQYDLFGIICHYGSLTYGHYISMVKNPYDQQWYKYDDQFRIQIQESQIQKENAYILFYIRKDLQHKTMEDVFPSINQTFPGKPVRTKFGDGFILGETTSNFTTKPDQPPKFYVKIGEAIHEVDRDDIYPDPD
mmetsp:Transcript_42310/g.64888  ORF Transcript_42310/g.64888 Transcript_42310/m.64888 type:complete len:160 (+) Transcript_42310:4156-4635(+)